jgi:hypothetical protein
MRLLALLQGLGDASTVAANKNWPQTRQICRVAGGFAGSFSSAREGASLNYSLTKFVDP